MTQVYHTKICIRCHIEQPLNRFAKDPRYQDGYKSACKNCHNANRNKVLADQKPSFFPKRKTCTNCLIEKPVNEFYKNRRSKDGYPSWCKTCKDASDDKYHRRPERTTPRRKYINTRLTLFTKWCYGCETEKSLDEFQADESKKNGTHTQCKECRANASHISWAKNTEKHAVKNKEWRTQNPLKISELSRRRAARIAHASVGTVSYKRILDRDGMWCYICEKTIEPHHKVHFDHVIPLAHGGAHSEDNIKPTHDLCNCRKRDRLLSEMTPFQRRGLAS